MPIGNDIELIFDLFNKYLSTLIYTYNKKITTAKNIYILSTVFDIFLGFLFCLFLNVFKLFIQIFQSTPHFFLCFFIFFQFSLFFKKVYFSQQLPFFLFLFFNTSFNFLFLSFIKIINFYWFLFINKCFVANIFVILRAFP